MLLKLVNTVAVARPDRNSLQNVSSTYGIEMSGNIFFNPIFFYSKWFIPIPIPNPRFSLVLLTFTSASIPVLLVVSRSDNK